jgi:hypothetical protein
VTIHPQKYFFNTMDVRAHAWDVFLYLPKHPVFSLSHARFSCAQHEHMPQNTVPAHRSFSLKITGRRHSAAIYRRIWIVSVTSVTRRPAFSGDTRAGKSIGHSLSIQVERCVGLETIPRKRFISSLAARHARAFKASHPCAGTDLIQDVLMSLAINLFI